ncbi:MAG: hypothetical protein ABIC91_08555 [Nanoarchaeota archaeon]|nr:hypothetical protein [Nanoarchaeota archaeon]MBU1030314.1 hypothetical protein [Nanoarchaeota archaeon]MBU1849327.1 hypothetical protein [Nanoarchaeota archaeon]
MVKVVSNVSGKGVSHKLFFGHSDLVFSESELLKVESELDSLLSHVRSANIYRVRELVKKFVSEVEKFVSEVEIEKQKFLSDSHVFLSGFRDLFSSELSSKHLLDVDFFNKQMEVLTHVLNTFGIFSRKEELLCSKHKFQKFVSGMASDEVLLKKLSSDLKFSGDGSQVDVFSSLISGFQNLSSSDVKRFESDLLKFLLFFERFFDYSTSFELDLDVLVRRKLLLVDNYLRVCRKFGFDEELRSLSSVKRLIKVDSRKDLSHIRELKSFSKSFRKNFKYHNEQTSYTLERLRDIVGLERFRKEKDFLRFVAENYTLFIDIQYHTVSCSGETEYSELLKLMFDCDKFMKRTLWFELSRLTVFSRLQKLFLLISKGELKFLLNKESLHSFIDFLNNHSNFLDENIVDHEIFNEDTWTHILDLLNLWSAKVFFQVLPHIRAFMNKDDLPFFVKLVVADSNLSESMIQIPYAIQTFSALSNIKTILTKKTWPYIIKIVFIIIKKKYYDSKILLNLIFDLLSKQLPQIDDGFLLGCVELVKSMIITIGSIDSYKTLFDYLLNVKSLDKGFLLRVSELIRTTGGKLVFCYEYYNFPYDCRNLIKNNNKKIFDALIKMVNYSEPSIIGKDNSVLFYYLDENTAPLLIKMAKKYGDKFQDFISSLFSDPGFLELYPEYKFKFILLLDAFPEQMKLWLCDGKLDYMRGSESERLTNDWDLEHYIRIRKMLYDYILMTKYDMLTHIKCVHSLFSFFCRREIGKGRSYNDINPREFALFMSELKKKDIIGPFGYNDIVLLKTEFDIKGVSKRFYSVQRVSSEGYFIKEITPHGLSKQVLGPFPAGMLSPFIEPREWRMISKIDHDTFLILHSVTAFRGNGLKSIDDAFFNGYSLSACSIAKNKKYGQIWFPTKSDDVYSIGFVFSKGTIYDAFYMDSRTKQSPQSIYYKVPGAVNAPTRVPVKIALKSDFEHNELLVQNWVPGGLYYTLFTPPDIVQQLKVFCLHYKLGLYFINENSFTWTITSYKDLKNFALKDYWKEITTFDPKATKRYKQLLKKKKKIKPYYHHWCSA